MVGKLTDDSGPSCSLLASIMGESPHKSQNEALDGCMRAGKGLDIRNEQNSIMLMGDRLEATLLNGAKEDLDLDSCITDINTKVVHTEIPLQGSLDGICEVKEPRIIKEDPANNIYVMTKNKEALLDGQGVLECKITSAYPESPNELPLWRGPLQLQGLMDITDSKYGILVVLYQSIHIRYFIYEREEETVNRIHEAVLDFDRRIREKDYFEAKDPEDAVLIYPEAQDSHLDLEQSAIKEIGSLERARDMIKRWTAEKDKHQANLMELLGDNTTGSVSHDGTTYIIKWGMRNIKPKPEKIIPATEGYAVRSKTITVKHIIEDQT